MLRNTYSITVAAMVVGALVLVGAFQLVPGLNGSPTGTTGSHNPLPIAESSDVPKETEQRVIQAYGKLPLHFEPNQGQIAEEAKFNGQR